MAKRDGRRNKKPWTREDDQQLLEGRARRESYRQIKKRLPKRTLNAVIKRIIYLRLPNYVNRLGYKHWTTGETKLLTKLWFDDGLSLREIMKLMPTRSWRSIRCKVNELSRQLGELRPCSGRMLKWVSILTRPHTNEEAAKIMGVTRNGVSVMRWRLRKNRFEVLNSGEQLDDRWNRATGEDG